MSVLQIKGGKLLVKNGRLVIGNAGDPCCCTGPCVCTTAVKAVAAGITSSERTFLTSGGGSSATGFTGAFANGEYNLPVSIYPVSGGRCGFLAYLPNSGDFAVHAFQVFGGTGGVAEWTYLPLWCSRELLLYVEFDQTTHDGRAVIRAGPYIVFSGTFTGFDGGELVITNTTAPQATNFTLPNSVGLPEATVFDLLGGIRSTDVASGGTLTISCSPSLLAAFAGTTYAGGEECDEDDYEREQVYRFRYRYNCVTDTVVQDVTFVDAYCTTAGETALIGAANTWRLIGSGDDILTFEYRLVGGDCSLAGPPPIESDVTPPDPPTSTEITAYCEKIIAYVHQFIFCCTDFEVVSGGVGGVEPDTYAPAICVEEGTSPEGWQLLYTFEAGGKKYAYFEHIAETTDICSDGVSDTNPTPPDPPTAEEIADACGCVICADGCAYSEDSLLDINMVRTFPDGSQDRVVGTGLTPFSLACTFNGDVTYSTRPDSGSAWSDSSLNANVYFNAVLGKWDITSLSSLPGECNGVTAVNTPGYGGSSDIYNGTITIRDNEDCGGGL